MKGKEIRILNLSNLLFAKKEMLVDQFPETSLNDYRYTFQGQESDDEVKGEGNSVNYKYRMHDPRVGRFFAVDPLAPEYPHLSPYAFSGNHVIDAVELEGLEEFRVIDKGNGTSYLVWDITARKRGQGGMIEYISNGQVIGSMRKFILLPKFQTIDPPFLIC